MLSIEIITDEAHMLDLLDKDFKLAFKAMFWELKETMSKDIKKSIRMLSRGFPGGAVVENLPANAGDTGSSPGLGRSHMPRSNWAREPQ